MKKSGMAKAIARLFIKNIDQPELPAVRMHCGVLSTAIGIVLNLILFAVKLIVGTMSGSVSITADAVNNLSDAGSCVVVLASFRMAGKPADQEHPFGHARIEYIATSAVAVVILSIGIELLKASYAKILHPNPIDFHLVSILVLAIAIGVKFWMYLFNTGLGRHIGSSVMRATAIDSLSDVAATSAVLASTLLSPLIGFQLDGYMGAGVSFFILYSGLKILKETMGSMLGQGPTRELVQMIESYIRKYNGVLDLHDLVVHDYGPTRSFASVHVEVDARVDILESHELIDTIERQITEDHGIHLVIHLDPVVRDDPKTDQLRELAEQVIADIDPSLSLHDFRVVSGRTHNKLIFDITAPFTFKMSDRILQETVESKLFERDHGLQAVIVVDRSPISD